MARYLKELYFAFAIRRGFLGLVSAGVSWETFEISKIRTCVSGVLYWISKAYPRPRYDVCSGLPPAVYSLLISASTTRLDEV
jgi:hypothetical protein